MGKKLALIGTICLLMQGSAIACNGGERSLFRGSYYDIRHPENQPGEVFVTNIGVCGGEDWFARIEWKTKRLGNQAFDIYGHLLDACSKPVFALRSEVEGK